VVKELKVKVGDKVAEGSVVLTLEAAGEAAAAPQAAAALLQPPAPRTCRAGSAARPLLLRQPALVAWPT
jgi:dihydrolipoamide dehydrogenase